MSGIKRLSGNPLLYLIFRPLASNALGLSQKTPTVCNTFPEMGFEGQALRKALTRTLNFAHSPLRLFQVWMLIGHNLMLHPRT